MRRGKKATQAVFAEKIADLENKWKRALADYDNLQKRIQKEKEKFVKFSNAQLLDKLLTVLDDLERCEKHAKDKGVSLVCERFKDVLSGEGIQEIEALGKRFEPKTMDAVEIAPGPKNKVVGVILKGYSLNGEVLRPAKVKVGGGEKSAFAKASADKEKIKKLETEKLRGEYV